MKTQKIIQISRNALCRKTLIRIVSFQKFDANEIFVECILYIILYNI